MYYPHSVRNDYDKAEELYKRAIKADPGHGYSLYNYAVLLEDVRAAYDDAEKYYKLAIEASPNDSLALGDYAAFLKVIWLI